jgi:hypothetical protein
VGLGNARSEFVAVGTGRVGVAAGGGGVGAVVRTLEVVSSVGDGDRVAAAVGGVPLLVVSEPSFPSLDPEKASTAARTAALMTPPNAARRLNVIHPSIQQILVWRVTSPILIALFPGGNDYPAREAGVDCIQVRDHDETKRVIEALLVNLEYRD